MKLTIILLGLGFLSDRPVKWHFKNAHSVKVKKAKEFWILSSILCLTVTGLWR